MECLNKKTKTLLILIYFITFVHYITQVSNSDSDWNTTKSKRTFTIKFNQVNSSPNTNTIQQSKNKIDYIIN